MRPNDFVDPYKTDWAVHKAQARSISKAYKQLRGEYALYSDRISECSKVLVFNPCSAENHRTLNWASFCKVRLCPFCMRRYYYRNVQNFIDVYSHYRKKIGVKSDIPIILTLSVTNYPLEHLPETIDKINESFSRLMKRQKPKKVVKAYYRSIDIAYNREYGFYPRLNVLMMLPERFFRGDQSIKTLSEEWLVMWEESAHNLQVKNFNIQLIKNAKRSLYRGDIFNRSIDLKTFSVFNMICKYPIDLGYLYDHEEISVGASVVKYLHQGIHSKRLIGFGGVFRDIQKELKLKD